MSEIKNIFIIIALILLLAVAGVSCLLLRTKPAQPVTGKTEVKALPTPTPAPIQRNTEIALPEPVWAPEEPDKSDKLQPGAVIWLGEYSDFIEKLRKAAPGKSKVLFQEPAGLGSYRKQLAAIADAAPEAVLLNISGKYAKNNISLASFENMIREAAAFFRDRNIPAAFVLSASDSTNEEIQKFNKAVTELCNLRSINCFKANTPPGEIFETMQIK